MANLYTPRFGSAKNEDNTGNTRTSFYSEPAYAASITVKPNASNSVFNFAQLTGALTLIVGTALAKAGDTIDLLFSADGSARTVTLSTGLSSSASTLVVSASKFASISYRYNGTTWVETSRTITA